MITNIDIEISIHILKKVKHYATICEITLDQAIHSLLAQAIININILNKEEENK